MSGEVDDAHQIRASPTGLQTCTDQSLDQIAMQMQMQGSQQSELAKQLETQNSRHDELMTGMRMTTNQQLDQVAPQIQVMLTLIASLVNSVIPTPHPENLPGQDPSQRPRQLTGLNSTVNVIRPRNASHREGRLGWFECDQMGYFAKKCPKKISIYLNYRGPGQ